MADDEVQKLRKFIILNAEEKLSHEKYQRLRSAIEKPGKQFDLLCSLRRQACAAHVDWFTAYKKMYGTTKELLERDCIRVEGPNDLEALADLRDLYYYNGKCGIRDGQAFENELRRKAEQLNFKVVTLPSSG